MRKHYHRNHQKMADKSYVKELLKEVCGLYQHRTSGLMLIGSFGRKEHSGDMDLIGIAKGNCRTQEVSCVGNLRVEIDFLPQKIINKMITSYHLMFDDMMSKIGRLATGSILYDPNDIFNHIQSNLNPMPDHMRSYFILHNLGLTSRLVEKLQQGSNYDQKAFLGIGKLIKYLTYLSGAIEQRWIVDPFSAETGSSFGIVSDVLRMDRDKTLKKIENLIQNILDKLTQKDLKSVLECTTLRYSVDHSGWILLSSYLDDSTEKIQPRWEPIECFEITKG